MKDILSPSKKKNGKMMVNATQMAKAFGKKPSDWLRTEQANRIINAVFGSHFCEPTDLVVVINGGDDYGTWMHEDVALEEPLQAVEAILSRPADVEND